MRCFIQLGCFGLVLVLSSLGCDNGSPDGSGGTGGTGGGGAGGGMGGDGGMGGGGGPVRMCGHSNDCIDFGRDTCITSACIDMVCHFGSAPDAQFCFSDTGASACLGGVCQSIWPMPMGCSDPDAQDGDFCEPTESVPRLGRCESGSCEINPCEIAFDCWDGDLCTFEICESGECRHEAEPDGTICGIFLQCVDGSCVRGGGTGGQGGAGGQGGGGGGGG